MGNQGFLRMLELFNLQYIGLLNVIKKCMALSMLIFLDSDVVAMK